MCDRVGQPRAVARSRQRPRVVADEVRAPLPADVPETGDLFEHFALALAGRGARGPRPLVEVVACSHCGWWLAAASVEQHLPCPLCGSPS
jgi:hypothetical protein